MTDLNALQAWLDAYVDAWRSPEPDKIGALFTEDATYAYEPYDSSPERGRKAIVAAWLKDPDQPGSFECHYQALAVNGDLGVAQGWTRYRNPEREYRNIFVVRLDDQGRCSEFTEWYMKVPESAEEIPELGEQVG